MHEGDGPKHKDFLEKVINEVSLTAEGIANIYRKQTSKLTPSRHAAVVTETMDRLTQTIPKWGAAQGYKLEQSTDCFQHQKGAEAQSRSTVGSETLEIQIWMKSQKLEPTFGQL